MQEKKNNWRFRLGGGLFFLGFIFPAFIPLVLMIDMPSSWKTGFIRLKRTSFHEGPLFSA